MTDREERHLRRCQLTVAWSAIVVLFLAIDVYFIGWLPINLSLFLALIALLLMVVAARAMGKAIREHSQSHPKIHRKEVL